MQHLAEIHKWITFIIIVLTKISNLLRPIIHFQEGQIGSTFIVLKTHGKEKDILCIKLEVGVGGPLKTIN